MIRSGKQLMFSRQYKQLTGVLLRILGNPSQSVMAHGGSNFHKHYSDGHGNLRVLLDMDGVLCDFEGHFLARYKELFPDEPCVELEDREGFYLRDQYDLLKPGLHELCSRIYSGRGFFQHLPEIPGAVEAAREMYKMEGVDVFICTSPLSSYKHCLREKFHWVEKHLGRNWLARTIITKDKTMANGHLLIDDRPNITGLNPNPSWDHVIFTACHNVRVNDRGKRRLENWTDGTWRDLIKDYKKRVA